MGAENVVGVYGWVGVDQDRLRSRRRSVSPDLKSPRTGLANVGRFG